jgi:hypothetical protein
MNKKTYHPVFGKAFKALTLSALACVLLGIAPSPAKADSPVTMAPPLQSPSYHVTQNSSLDSAQDSVFQWSEVPQNQKVAIQRAVFDRDGYQLYDTKGETIVVPFTNNNLYVMQFAQTKDKHMYFVNHNGTVPTLYIPKNGYLENDAVPGARWYPFSKDFHPSRPVYVGIAPSWSDFIGMGWYPGMDFWGGYWGSVPFFDGGIFEPSFGLYFQIGGHPYYGWSGYHDYFAGHPTRFYMGSVRPNAYNEAVRPQSELRSFQSNGHAYTAHRAFLGANAVSGGRHGFGGFHGFGGGEHGFGGGFFGGGRGGFGGGHPDFGFRGR